MSEDKEDEERGQEARTAVKYDTPNELEKEILGTIKGVMLYLYYSMSRRM